MLNCIIVGMGGFLGAVARYLIGLIPINPQNGFPIKTLLINIIGAFVIGLVVAFGAKKDWNPQLILFLKVGIEQNRYAMACRGCGIVIFCFL